MSDEVWLTLPSNSSMSTFSHNTLQNYVTRLAEPLNLNENYEAALAQITFPNSFSREQIQISRDGSDEAYLFTLKIKKSGNLEPIEKNYKLKCTEVGKKYYSMQHLTSCINREITEYRRSLPNSDPLGLGKGGASDKPFIKYDETYKTYSVVNDVGSQYYVRLALHHGLASKYGFRRDQFPLKPLRTETEVTTSNPVREISSNSVQSVYVYTDMIMPQLVGDVRAPLLRICNPEGLAGDVTNKEFTRLQYYPLLKNSFQYVEIDLRDDEGAPIPFASYGRVVCVIHIRPRRHHY